MNHIIKFSAFEKANYKDISFISSLDKYFTVSFEFEIETDDKSNIKIDVSMLHDDEVVSDIISIIIHEVKIRKKSEKKFIENIIYSIVDLSTKKGIVSSSIIEDIFNEDNFESDREREISSFSKSILMSYISGEDMEYLISQANKYLPNFTKKWEQKIDFVEDVTLERGIEIKPKKYLFGISEGIEMINDFYEDLNNQSYWKFSSRTGIHINIGVNDEDADWNPIKGLLMLNDFSLSAKTPLVFKDIAWRMNNQFCGSLISSIKKMDKEEIDYLKRSIDLDNIEYTESILSDFLTGKIKELGHKNFGFNLIKLDSNYIEFRYVGGIVKKEILIEKLKYFSFVVYSMTNQDYKREEYLKKLYKFIDSL